MSPVVVALLALAALAFGYRFYSRFLERDVFVLRADEAVPADGREDGVDFVKTPRGVLWGHHFSSIAGAAPILGPAMAIVWGWVPAVLWIVVGVIFMGAAHDFGALVLSHRHAGSSVGNLTEKLIGPRSRLLFLVVIAFLIWMVSAVFTFSIGNLFVAEPASILPVNVEIIVAMCIGWWGYRMRRSLTVPSVVVLIGLYVLIFVCATNAAFVPSVGSIFLDIDFWLVFLLVYGFVASTLPVWLLLQPRDLINSHQLVVGLTALYVGFFVARPAFAAPAVGDLSALPPALPLLMVTIACGAISGFHGLVSSGTTSKQLGHASDIRPIGYGAMLAEATLALLSTLAVAAGVMADGHTHVWDALYVPTLADGNLPGVGVALKGFVNGAASMLTALGLPARVGAVVVAVLVISFAATSLDTALRIQRLVIAELGRMMRLPVLENRFVGGVIAVGSVAVLVWADKDARAQSLWPVFGATNQVLAAITLLMCALYLKKTGRKPMPYLVPAVFVMLITFASMGIQVYRDLLAEKVMVASVGALIAILTVWVALEGFIGWRRAVIVAPDDEAV
jgi:carbon starvation protein